MLPWWICWRHCRRTGTVSLTILGWMDTAARACRQRSRWVGLLSSWSSRIENIEARLGVCPKGKRPIRCHSSSRNTDPRKISSSLQNWVHWTILAFLRPQSRYRWRLQAPLVSYYSLIYYYTSAHHSITKYCSRRVTYSISYENKSSRGKITWKCEKD